jgi:ATP-dependent helicase HrpA
MENLDGFPSPYMRPDDLVATIDQTVVPDAFPDELVVGETRLPLEYRFEPGGDRDGICVTVHQAALAQVSDDRLGWLVPGLLEAKLTAMIKSLPKRIRRNLVPAADVAKRIAGELAPRYGEVPFMQAVCEAFSRVAEMRVTAEDFTEEKLEPHLDFLVQVVDDEGKTIAQSRGIDQAKRDVGVSPVEVAQPTDIDDQSWSRTDMTTFDIDELPEQVVRVRGGVRVAQFPGLVDTGKAVQTRLFADKAASATATRGGLIRLFAISERKELRAQVRHFPGLGDLKVRLAQILPTATIEDDLVDLLARRAFVEEVAMPRSQSAFDALRGQRGKRIGEAACDVAPWLSAFADAYHSARKGWEAMKNDRTGAIADIKRQVAYLTQPGFLRATPWQWLKHYPRYFQAIAYRLDKLNNVAGRDADSMRLVNDLWIRWLASLAVADTTPAAIGNAITDFEMRWMLEELRVSLFAQPLGTSIKVSPQRCEKMICQP